MDTRKVTMDGVLLTVRGNKLFVGDRAPEFKLLDNDLKLKTLESFGDKIKLISIVPSLDTDVCDKQTRRFNKELSSFDGVVGITVSVDLPFAQKKWCGNAGLKDAITLSDHLDVAFGESYGVLIEELRLLARAVLVLDKQNKITYIEYLNEMTYHPDYDQALSAVRNLL